ncbi:MAG: hypothetical protein SGARI_000602 [Bacillariaceae sp.]
MGKLAIADCYPLLDDGTRSETPDLLYADYNIASCVSQDCVEQEMEPLFRRYAETDVQNRLESSGSQSCDVTRVRVTQQHDNIFVRDNEDSSSIAGVDQTCQDDTLALLEEASLSSDLENLNLLASNVPLNDRCYKDPEMGSSTRLCELDYQNLNEGNANDAVQQSCEALGGSSVYVSFLVHCHLLGDSQTEDPVLIYNDINIGACISPTCTEAETATFYEYLMNEEVDAKLEGGGSQSCTLETMSVEKSHRSNVFASRQRIPESSENGDENGSDSFATMPTPAPYDIAERKPENGESDSELFNSSARCNQTLSVMALIALGSVWCFLSLLL